MTNITDPITRQPFNILAYVPVILLVGSIAAVWSNLNSAQTSAQAATIALEARVSRLEVVATGNTNRIGILETGFGRLEERLVAIGEGVTRIERAIGGQP